jgi:hypothetical protein
MGSYLGHPSFFQQFSYTLAVNNVLEVLDLGRMELEVKNVYLLFESLKRNQFISELSICLSCSNLSDSFQVVADYFKSNSGKLECLTIVTSRGLVEDPENFLDGLSMNTHLRVISLEDVEFSEPCNLEMIARKLARNHHLLQFSIVGETIEAFVKRNLKEFWADVRKTLVFKFGHICPERNILAEIFAFAEIEIQRKHK